MARNKWHRFGYACVNFGSPVSLRAYARSRDVDFRSLAKEERFARVEELGKELMAAIARVIPVVPVPLVATVFARDPAKLRSELELKAEVLDLMHELSERGAHVYVPRKDQDYAITVGLRTLMLRHLVEEKEGLYAARSEELPLLTYYANSVAHLFG
jgi:glycerol-3-phosphate O-acyltransferase